MICRELTPDEVRRLLIPKKRKWTEPVLYRGLEPTREDHVVRYTLERTVRKVVAEDDAFLLVRQGWTIVEIDDPDDDD